MSRADSTLIALGLALALGAAPLRADPVSTPATATVNEGGTAYGPFPFGVSLESDIARSDGGQGGTVTQAALGDAATGSLGWVYTQGHVTGPSRQSAPAVNISSSATVWFALSITPLGGGMVLPAYPLRVQRLAEVSQSHSGLVGGGVAAGVSLDGVVEAVGYQYYGGSFADGFSHVNTMWLSPGEHHGYVQASGWASAQCQKLDAKDPDDKCIKGTASYTAVADPSFAFDQAAWDAQYPNQPLDLAASYRIDLNPNVPTGPVPLVNIGAVPEPAAAGLWLLGLAGLAAGGRWRRRALRASAR